MTGIINILPDSVANQIAAGEVIQRPASVVKELIENSVDAGSSSITVIVKDAGKTLIQVIDNGAGMTENDARICWERHATSKIMDANDLFSIQTKGFRGEALASIAAISEVSLKTRPEDQEVGTHIKISGSKILSNEPVGCPKGSNFNIKNLFFNVPARRKFLKSNATELRHIINEIYHVALAHPSIEFSLFHNNSQVFSIPRSGLRQRIINIMGKNLNQSLINLNSETSLVNISGFIGKPEYAKKTYGEQFFFVNGRYIRHPYFHKAVLKAYEQILHPDAIPAYFIFFETDPDKIDVNIHPTKTEIKFEDEQAIWQILQAVVKESIGKNNLSPSLNFDNEGIIDIPVLKKDTSVSTPRVNINPDYNPFKEETIASRRPDTSKLYQKERNENWESVFHGIRREEEQMEKEDTSLSTNENDLAPFDRFMQLKSRFILTPVKSGLMIIDQKRAHERVLYEQVLQRRKENKFPSQKLLFPEAIELNASDFVTFLDIKDAIAELGFDISEFGKNSIIVNGIPDTVKNSDIKSLIEEILEEYKSLGADTGSRMIENLARSVAKASAIPYGKVLEMKEMRDLFDQLFACGNPNHSPTGKPVISIIRIEEIEKSLKG
ncbi:MAG: DNA mismatch repair endonuclease MutL [Bacteroidales bacterium]